jgi:ADP-ribose pyrophosphatase YjhB (NUDIX family)
MHKVSPEIEASAKAICRTMHPDKDLNEPLFENLPAWIPDATLPAWRHYVEAAEASLAASPRYDNTPTVVVVLVPCNGGLLMVRRALKDGYGKLALPGGFQERPLTWQQAACKEVKEETGVDIIPEGLVISDVRTTPDGGVNLLFCKSLLEITHEGAFTHDHEISEVTVIHEPVETAFPFHTAAVREYFAAVRAYFNK